MDTGIPPRVADTLRGPFDPVGIVFARFARAPHVVLDAGQMSRLQFALADMPHQRDPGCRGEWAAFHGADG